ncbi:MAG TPA: HEPN domain-containing protein [Terriglobales bacterium]|nr:HEPN domain-containing protein [Terriglobales bacterium]
MPKRYPPEDPREWLNRARSNLAKAKVRRKGVYLEDLCFDAQQAAEKAIKAVLIKQDVKFPYVHDLAELFTLAEEAGIKTPKSMKMAGELSKFAVFTRYPFESSPIVEKEYKEAVKIAEAVLRWAEGVISGKRRK